MQDPEVSLTHSQTIFTSDNLRDADTKLLPEHHVQIHGHNKSNSHKEIKFAQHSIEPKKFENAHTEELTSGGNYKRNVSQLRISGNEPWKSREQLFRSKIQLPY